MLTRLGFQNKDANDEDDMDDIAIVEVVEPLWRSEFVSMA